MATVSEIKAAAESDLLTFIRLVAPKRVIGSIHEEICQWWERSEHKSHQLVLLPRGHQKSTFIAYRVAWEITKNPTITILYLSSASGLAEQQLSLIKTIITSKNYKRYWPEMVNPEEGKREKWTLSEISVDHPRRKEEQVRDPTVFTAGLTSSKTGWHCDLAVLDDVVVQENAYTEEGRHKVQTQYSLLSSIENPGAREWVVGTRYDPNDLYASMIGMNEDVYDEDGTVIEERPVYEVFERQVEDKGDGTGEFIWPKQQRLDGAWYGFDREILARKKAQYLDKTQFYAQYYNNPNMGGEGGIKRDRFQYYDKSKVSFHDNGSVSVLGKPCNVFAAIDFAFSLSNKADYTAIVVIGIDDGGNIYILEIDRFKTDKISDYFSHIRDLHVKWGFRKLRAETTAAQAMIVTELRDSYFRPYGIALSIDEHRPSRMEGSKEERIKAVLQHRYENQSIWHYKGGLCSSLEEELMQQHPAHDDIKDSLAAAVSVSVPPRGYGMRKPPTSNIIYHSKFGGVA